MKDNSNSPPSTVVQREKSKAYSALLAADSNVELLHLNS